MALISGQTIGTRSVKADDTDTLDIDVLALSLSF